MSEKSLSSRGNKKSPSWLRLAIGSPLASLKLTLLLLALSIVLIFAGTLAQVNATTWTVQKVYFHSLIVWIPLNIFTPREWNIRGGFYFPGGYTIGALMLCNLLAAHAMRFKLTWKRSGIIMIHSALIMLLVGEFFTSTQAVEGQMILNEGASANYTQDSRHTELAAVDMSMPDTDLVVAFGQSMLQPGATLSHAVLPFSIHLDRYARNSEILGPMQVTPQTASIANAGSDQKISFQEVPPVSDMDSQDMASAFVTLSVSGSPIGTYLLSQWAESPQFVEVGNKTYAIALRGERQYKPYTIKLLKFSHDRYTGTDIPRNFSSRVELIDSRAGVDREVLIKMNSPLRYAGDTLYQASFKKGDKTTILQVVSNPVAQLPYIACIIGGLGLAIHFSITLGNYIRKQVAPRGGGGPPPPRKMSPTKNSGGYVMEPKRAWPGRMVAGGAVALGAIIIASALVPAISDKPKEGEFDLAGFGNLPVLFDGRPMPLETLARTNLQVLSGRDHTAVGSEALPPAEWDKVPSSQWKSVPAMRWLADIFAHTEASENYRVFRIDNDDVIGALGLDVDRNPRLYSFKEVFAQRNILEDQSKRLENVESRDRSIFQQKIAELVNHLNLFARLVETDSLYLVPPLSQGGDWQQLSNFPAATLQKTSNRAAVSMRLLAQDYANGDIANFNADLARYRLILDKELPTGTSRLNYEAFFDRFAPFMWTQILYVLVFIIECAALLFWNSALRQSAFALALLAFALHAFALGSRLYISGRPPVTNLYSSAIFIAFGVIIAGLAMEGVFRNAIATMVSATIGALSLQIAHHLAGDGDTMRQMQAVLDTNFWLATHVVCITLGYAATFFSGGLAIAYILLGVFTPALSAENSGLSGDLDGGFSDVPLSKILAQMVYAIVCFAMLFSFVGTILGGIWADQSWGRFWGWDPKENGAVLIVLWNALILHARWSGLVKQRGMMNLAVFGNIVTSWSWFGTNMLGVGLHAYGFIDKALMYMLIFVASQLLIIVIGTVPTRFWRSFREADAPKPDDALSLPV